MQEIYRQFISKAARGHKMSYKELDKLARGRVYMGRMAAENGLIDELGTLHDAVAEAKKAAWLKPAEEVELLILPKPTSIFEQLFGEPTVSSQLQSVAPELVELARKTSFSGDCSPSQC